MFYLRPGHLSLRKQLENKIKQWRILSKEYCVIFCAVLFCLTKSKSKCVDPTLNEVCEPIAAHNTKYHPLNYLNSSPLTFPTLEYTLHVSQLIAIHTLEHNIPPCFFSSHLITLHIYNIIIKSYNHMDA